MRGLDIHGALSSNEQESDHNQTRLIYITSLGHSGSTLVDMSLGTIPSVFSTGELRYLPWQLYREKYAEELSEQAQNICTCGKRFSTCAIWRPVVDSLSHEYGYDIMEEPFRFRIDFLGSQRYAGNVSLAKSILRKCVNHGMSSPFSKIVGVIAKAVSDKIVLRNWELISKVSQVTGSDWVVDSTKDPLRLFHLACHFPRRVRVLVLFRSLRGYIASAMKRGSEPDKEICEWFRFYSRINKLIGRMQSWTWAFLNYEDFCRQPSVELARISRTFGITMTNHNGNKRYIDTSQYHMVAGNKMRYGGKIEIRVDDSWRNILTRNELDKIEDVLATQGHPLKEYICAR